MHYNVQKNVLKEMEGIISELAKDTVDLHKIREELQVDDFDCTELCKQKSKGCNE